MSPLFPLLGLLARGDAYGYELKRVVETEFDPYWKIDFAQLYRSLAKLDAQGYVSARAQKGAAGPERHVYRLTARGRRALARWLAQPAEGQDDYWVKSRLAPGLESSAQMPLYIVGSDDPLLAWLARSAGATARVMGSTRGLERLAEQQADIAGAHLREPDTADFNVSFVQHLIPEQDIVLVNLAVRDYGLMVATGNPKEIRRVRDLAKKGVRLVNRRYGAGARVWLHRHLGAAGVEPTGLDGWERTAPTYEALARAIEKGTADAAPSIRATAEARGLGFVPLGEERFDLILARGLYESPRARTLRDMLEGKTLREMAKTLPGYDLARCGRVVGRVNYGRRRK
jgi:molybdate-binding protein/DNA-binding PadR family transcriptional regulator